MVEMNIPIRIGKETKEVKITFIDFLFFISVILFYVGAIGSFVILAIITKLFNYVRPFALWTSDDINSYFIIGLLCVRLV
jgi:hypothetical protein